MGFTIGTTVFTHVNIRDGATHVPEGCGGSGASLRAPGILVLFFGKSRGNASQSATNVFAKLAKTCPEFVSSSECM